MQVRIRETEGVWVCAGGGRGRKSFLDQGCSGRELSGRGTEGNLQAQGTVMGNKDFNQLH